MASSGGHLIQDQNINVEYNGVSFGGKMDPSTKVQKKGLLGGRRALNDISNSGKPSAHQESKAKNSKILLNIGKDPDASKTVKTAEAKRNISKGQEKVHTGGRKALSNVTNSAKLPAQPNLKKAPAKKLTSVEEKCIPVDISEEQFLHNHQDCMKQQKMGMDLGYFLDIIGLKDGLDDPVQEASSRVGSPLSAKLQLVESAMPELLMNDQVCQRGKVEAYDAPTCGSPESPKASPYSSYWGGEILPSFKLIETPKLDK